MFRASVESYFPRSAIINNRSTNKLRRLVHGQYVMTVAAQAASHDKTLFFLFNEVHNLRSGKLYLVRVNEVVQVV